MATRNQVLSLFGATPEQIMQQQQRERGEDILKQQDPYARFGAAIGTGLANLFGGESEEVIRQRELYSMLGDVSFESPEDMRQAAKILQTQFPERALQLLDMADRKETANVARSLEGKTTVNKEVIVEVDTVNSVGEPIKKNIKIDVPYEYDRKTGKTKSIFGADYEQTLARRKMQEEGVEVEVTTETPQELARRVLLERTDRIPVGQVQKIDGRYIRRFGPGEDDIEILNIEEVRKLPTELGDLGAMTP